MDTLSSVFINVITIIVYLCVLLFFILVLIGFSTIIGMFISTAFSEIKLMIIKNKNRKDN